MALDYFKGFYKVRRTKGTKIYYTRNYIALATLGFGIISGIILCVSPSFERVTDFMNKDWFTTPEERQRKRNAFTFNTVAETFEEKMAEIEKKKN